MKIRTWCLKQIIVLFFFHQQKWSKCWLWFTPITPNKHLFYCCLTKINGIESTMMLTLRFVLSQGRIILDWIWNNNVYFICNIFRTLSSSSGAKNKSKSKLKPLKFRNLHLWLKLLCYLYIPYQKPQNSYEKQDRIESILKPHSFSFSLIVSWKRSEQLRRGVTWTWPLE